MQLSTLVTWLAALTVGAQAVSFGNNLKDQIILDSGGKLPRFIFGVSVQRLGVIAS